MLSGGCSDLSEGCHIPTRPHFDSQNDVISRLDDRDLSLPCGDEKHPDQRVGHVISSKTLRKYYAYLFRTRKPLCLKEIQDCDYSTNCKCNQAHAVINEGNYMAMPAGDECMYISLVSGHIKAYSSEFAQVE